MTPEPKEVTEARDVVAEAGDTDMDNIGLLSATPAHIDALTERLAEVERERDEARAYMPTWRKKVYGSGPIETTWYDLMLGSATVTGGGIVTGKDQPFYVGDGEKHDTLEAAAKSICARLRIPYVPVPDGI